MLHTYKNICAYQAAQRFVYKRIPFFKTPAMQYGDDVHKAFELRVGGQKPLPVAMQQWEPFAVPFDGRNVKVETKLGITAQGHSCDFFAKNVWGRTRIDVTLINGTAAYINDWKTGKSKYEDPFELKVNAVLLHAANPQLEKIVGTYTWLAENRLSERYDLSDTRKTWWSIHEIVRSIENDKLTGHFEKRRSGLCAFCPCYECEHNTNPDKP